MAEMQLSKTNDLTQLQAWRGEEFVKREQATQMIDDCNKNINLITRRINEVAAEMAIPKNPKAAGASEQTEPNAEAPENDSDKPAEQDANNQPDPPKAD